MSTGTNSTAASRGGWTRRSNRWLAALAVAAVTFQLWIVYQATAAHSNGNEYNTQPLRLRLQQGAASTPILTNNNQNTRPPRLLIGIISNANNHMGLVYRDRHRQLFQLWNDSRLCLWKEFDPETCQVAYTFVLGGHNSTSAVPPYHLGTSGDNERPLTLDRIPSMPRFKDVSKADVTILNIRENMNDGKTPTFFHWAAQVARKHKIDYVMKCDSDAFLRWNALWRFLHKELPWPSVVSTSTAATSTSTSTSDTTTRGDDVVVPSTLLGAFRHKAYWKAVSDETLWQQEWYAGMHLYLAGQLYVLSVDVAEAMVVEARKWYTPQATANNITFCAPYSAGHEDHDATSMIQQDPQAIQRWMSIPKHTTFWEHPVKGDYRWQRILTREQRQKIERLEGKRPAIPHFDTVSGAPSATSRPSLLVILLEQFTTPADAVQQRDSYLQEWKRRNESNEDNKDQTMNSICPISKYHSMSSSSSRSSDAQCHLYYVFVVGTRNEGTTEVLLNIDTLRVQSPSTIEEDIWYFSVRHNVHEGMGTTALYYLHEKLPQYAERLELIVLIQSKHWLRLTKFQYVVQAQSSRHALVVGEIRDKYQEPREFPHTPGQHEPLWYNEFDNIHLYLGSDCLAFGSSLVAGMVEQAQTNVEARGNYFENNLGHDLTVLAYLVPKSILHWVPITKSLRFW